MVFGIGPAGTGKTYLAVAQAVSYLLQQAGRPASSSPGRRSRRARSSASCPGDLQQKVDPYLRPLYDALYDLIDYEKVERLFERNQIEVAPDRLHARAHALRRLRDHRRGAEHHHRADEDGADPHRPRLEGGGHRRHHPDRPAARAASPGLVEAISVLSGTEGIAFCYFDEKDVVRHRLVQSIIKAYERWGAGKGAGR